jgi:hypothetical protein
MSNIVRESRRSVEEQWVADGRPNRADCEPRHEDAFVPVSPVIGRGPEQQSGAPL